MTLNQNHVNIIGNMKKIIMNQTIPLLFKSQQELNEFIAKEEYQGKQTESGIKYLVKDENKER